MDDAAAAPPPPARVTEDTPLRPPPPPDAAAPPPSRPITEDTPLPTPGARLASATHEARPASQTETKAEDLVPEVKAYNEETPLPKPPKKGERKENFAAPRFMCAALDEAEERMKKVWADRAAKKAGPPPPPVSDAEKAVAPEAVWAACAAAPGATAAWDLLKRRIAIGDANCGAAAVADADAWVGALEAVDARLEAFDDEDPAGHALGAAAAGAWANCALCAAKKGDAAPLDAVATRATRTLVSLMSRALPVKAYVACAKALHALCVSSRTARDACLEEPGPEALATALAWAVLEVDDPDRQGRLAVRDEDMGCELLRVCYAIAAGGANKPFLEDKGNQHVTMIGICLRAILLDERNPWTVPQICKDGVHLLTCAPRTYYVWLVENGSAPRLLNLLEPLLVLYLVEEDPDAQRPDHQIVPLLNCLRKTVTSCARGLKETKELIFPPEEDEKWQARIAAEKAAIDAASDDVAPPEPSLAETVRDTSYITAEAAARMAEDAPPEKPLSEKGALRKKFEEARIHPVDAPKFAVRTYLFKLMTDHHATTKRIATELVFDLCARKVDEFTLRAGVGNAIAFLQVSKLVPLAPGQEDPWKDDR